MIEVQTDACNYWISKLECGLEESVRNGDDAFDDDREEAVGLSSRGTWPRSMGARVAPGRKP